VITITVAVSAHAERVVSEVSRWTSDRALIYTDRTIERDDGTREVRRVPGGIVDNIGMFQIAETAGGGPAIDFVPTRSTRTMKILHWNRSCVFITPNAAGSTQVAGSGEFDAIRRATENWNSVIESCGFVRLIYQPPEPDLEVGFDGKNTIIFREARWCTPAHGDEPEECHSGNITALTTVFYVPTGTDEGLILDADVEVNSVHFSMATGCETECMTDGTPTEVEDLENTMTHELGHVLGLAHTCWVDDPLVPSDEPPLDDRGNPAPACFPIAALPSVVRDATMFPYQDPREVKKRSVEADDRDGVCAAHPKAEDPMLCEPVDPGSSGCGVGGSGPSWLLGLLMALACSRIRRR